MTKSTRYARRLREDPHYQARRAELLGTRRRKVHRDNVQFRLDRAVDRVFARLVHDKQNDMAQAFKQLEAIWK